MALAKVQTRQGLVGCQRLPQHYSELIGIASKVARLAQIVAAAQNERVKRIEWVSLVVDVVIMYVAISRVLIHCDYARLHEGSLASLAHLKFNSVKPIFLASAPAHFLPTFGPKALLVKLMLTKLVLCIIAIANACPAL